MPTPATPSSRHDHRLPTYGTLKLAGVPVYDYQTIAASQLGKLSYTPTPTSPAPTPMYWSASGRPAIRRQQGHQLQRLRQGPTVAGLRQRVIQNSTGVAFGSWDFISPSPIQRRAQPPVHHRQFPPTHGT